MVILTEEQIKYLLEELSFETVVEPDRRKFNFRVQKKSFGYREGIPGTIQAALSIALEVEGLKKAFLPENS